MFHEECGIEQFPTTEKCNFRCKVQTLLFDSKRINAAIYITLPYIFTPTRQYLSSGFIGTVIGSVYYVHACDVKDV